jgi:hypothetical protein
MMYSFLPRRTKKIAMMEATMEMAPSTSGNSVAMSWSGKQEVPEQHGGHRRHGIGLEQIGRHAGAVAHVVAHVVGDDRRVAGVVFGNSGFHLAHQVGTDIRTLGEDAAAQRAKMEIRLPPKPSATRAMTASRGKRSGWCKAGDCGQGQPGHDHTGHRSRP